MLHDKWYVDEIYDRAVVRPLVALSGIFYRWFDRAVIDRVVDGFGRTAQGVGLFAGRTQTGQLNTYAFVIVVGVLVVLGSFVAF